ncbi:MAG: NAD-dependent epimerase/dehydratase family protein [Planctomycetota bacterium]|nr:NAD-dependent epimerase/dehydratase family protein [Planctomycetota bacterium]MDA1212394.1 NAD-dependent epimerase/dehydratase family protein [Planctomycetota bacterium]
MTTLVTGGAGFLGLYMTEQLVARGESVRVLCRRSHPRLKELGVQWIEGDIRDPSIVKEACANCDTVFHVAAIPGIWGAWKTFYETNTQGTMNVLAACRSEEVGKLIYTSSPSVVYDGSEHRGVNESLPYSDSYLCHYPHTKAIAERAVLDANGQDGLLTVSLRPHLIWGPRDNHLIPRLIQRAKSGRLRIVGDGKNLISMSYVENVASAHLQAAERLIPTASLAGKAYFINEPEPVMLWDWVNEILARAGLRPVTRRISKSAAWGVGLLCEGIYKTFGIKSEPPMTRFLASQLSGSHYYNIEAAKRDFDYRPMVPVEVGMQRMEPDLKRWRDS